MKKANGLLMMLVLTLGLSGCSGAFWGGTGAGVASTGAGYELNARQQMDRIQNDLKNGKINEQEYEIRKDQIKRMSVAY